MTPGAAEFSNDLFDQYEIVTGDAERQTVLAGFFRNGAMAELGVVHIDANGDRRVQLYGFDPGQEGAWVSVLDATLGAEVSFVDVANIAGRDRLITYQRGRLSWFDPEAATERVLVDVTSNFSPPRTGVIPNVDVTRDINDDDLDDLVVPDTDGFWVIVQMNDGTFADPVKIGPATDMSRIYGADGYRYDPWSQSRIYDVDENRDGRADLVFWRENRFRVHYQDSRGSFEPAARALTTDVAFDSDELDSLATGDMVGKVLHSVTDLNADDVPDLVVFSLEGASVKRKRSTYEMHFGTPAPDVGTVWMREPDAAVTSEGSIQLGMDTYDLDGDGQLDLMFTTIAQRFLERSFVKRIRGYMGDDVWLNLEFYSINEGVIPNAPDVIRRIQLHNTRSIREPGWVPLDVALRGGMHESRKALGRSGCIARDTRCSPHQDTFDAPLLIGDVTGDGRSDLLIGSTPKWLQLFVGAPGRSPFADQPLQVAVDLADDREYIWLVDLNRDAKQDILIHHASTTEPNRVVVLIAR